MAPKIIFATLKLTCAVPNARRQHKTYEYLAVIAASSEALFVPLRSSLVTVVYGGGIGYAQYGE